MSSSTKIDNKKNNVLVLGRGPTWGLEYTLSAKYMYSINLESIIKVLFRVCIIMEQTVIYLVMAQKFINLKQKILKV